MPAFLEQKLQHEYGQGSKIPFMIMNRMGVMHGNQETPQGVALQQKHDQDEATHRAVLARFK
jgi:uncharacterized protein YbcC (UPF0753/DUF2309 family)